jgi:hypothetical protein
MMDQDTKQQPTNQGPRRFTLILNDPTAEWSEIRSAMKAKAQQGSEAAACTNYSLMNALSASKSGGGASSGSSDNKNCKNSPPVVQSKKKDTTMATVIKKQAAVKEEVTVDGPMTIRPKKDNAAVNEKDNSEVPPAQDRLMPLENRRASLTSQDSGSKGTSSGGTARPSLRGHRQGSSRRRVIRQGSLRGSSSNRRLMLLRSSINSITESSFNSSAP